MKFLFLIVLLLQIVGTHCKEYIRVEKGNSVTLDCTTNVTARCTLLKNTQFEADRTGGAKFRVVNSSTCMFEATNLDFKDNGQYFCYYANSSKEYIILVTVKPHEPEFWHLGVKLVNNTKGITTTRQDGTTEFECRSYQGYPKADFLWFVDDDLRLDARETVRPEDGLLNTRSILTVNFDDSATYSFDGSRNPKEKVIKCAVLHDAYDFNESRILQGIFGKEYATENVQILLDDPLEKIINPGESIEIDCIADGLPEADDFQIMKETADGKWELVSSLPNINITEPGTYVCEARNRQSGRSLSNYTRSASFTFEGPVHSSISSVVNFGAIIGIVFGTIITIAIIIVIAFYLICPDKVQCIPKGDEEEGNKRRKSPSDVKYESETEKLSSEETKPSQEPLQSEI